MPELLGIIAPLRKFLSNTNETIVVQVDGTPTEILSLLVDRRYIIPDFQREIRWDKDNLSQLIDDIKSGPKYLGNVILTKKENENMFLIIDGQQRITVLIMILSCVERLHRHQINTIVPCTLSIESFEGFTDLLADGFPDKTQLNPNLLQSDKLFQIDKYYDLWDHIKKMDCVKNRHESRSFMENLGKSEVNIILNRSDDVKDSIRYFIDVNLKGKQLDTEDIFKSYLFRNDSSENIRSEWYKFKTSVSKIERTKMKYPLLKLLEHYFYCDLFNDIRYKGLEFGEDFTLKGEYKTNEETPVKFRAKTHLIEVVNDNAYMLNSLKKLNAAIEVMLNIVVNDSINEAFSGNFICSSDNNRPVRVDTTELKIIHNFIGKILKDDKVLPKALFMKYILTVLLHPESKNKDEYRKIYGAYLLSVLFVIFENKKSKDVLMSVLKASRTDWYSENIRQINSYFASDKITDNKIMAQYNKGTNEDDDDYRFRCKSLATIYNFFKIENDKIILSGSLDRVKKFITDDESFSTEHFIISNSNDRKMILICNGNEKQYTHSKEFFKRYVNSLFNFMFISQTLNSELGNSWLPQKIELVDPAGIECEYSKMVLPYLAQISNKMQRDIDEQNYRDKLDLFFSRDFKDQYITYARNVLNAVITKIKDEGTTAAP